MDPRMAAELTKRVQGKCVYFLDTLQMFQLLEKTRTAKTRHNYWRFCKSRPPILRCLHIEYAIPNIFASRLSLIIPSTVIPCCYSHVSTGVCSTPCCSPVDSPVVTIICKRPIVCKGRPRYECWQKQFPSSTPCRVISGANSASRPSPTCKIWGVRRLEQNIVQSTQ